MMRMPQPGGSPWVPGVLLIAGAALLAGVVGWSVGSTAWQTYGAITLGFILLAGWIERFRERSPTPPPRSRSRLRVIQGGRPDIDLEQDRSTDDQKYVM